MADFLAVFLIALQIADFLTTRAVLAHGGHEVNRVIAWIMSRIGPMPGLILTKMLAIALVFSLWKLGRVDVLSISTGVYAVVVFHNLRVYRKGRT